MIEIERGSSYERVVKSSLVAAAFVLAGLRSGSTWRAKCSGRLAVLVAGGFLGDSPSFLRAFVGLRPVSSPPSPPPSRRLRGGWRAHRGERDRFSNADFRVLKWVWC